MKRFKKTGAMLLASAIIATTGVAAVSFAAWTGSTANTTQTISGTTGKISYVGFDSTDANSTNNTAIVPFDETSGDKMVTIAVPAFTTSENYKINVKLSAAVTGATFYAQVAKNAPTAPASDSDVGGSTDWKEINTTGNDFAFNLSAVGAVDKVSDLNVYIVMKSSDVSAMNQSFSVVLTLAKQGA